MKIAVQVEDLRQLEKASQTECHRIRFGSEFCEWKTPDQDALKRAYAIVKDSGKPLVYVTPRVSNPVLDRIDEQLSFLDREGTFDVVANDLGVLNLIAKYTNLRPCLGRQLVCVPARCPWQQITPTQASPSSKRMVAKIFYQTALNYPLTARFFQNLGVRNIDVDWIPRCFPYFRQLIMQGFNLSLHLYDILVVVTRKCHTARFLGEAGPEKCSRPCYEKSFLLKQRALAVEFILKGNAVFRSIEPTNRDLKSLNGKEVEFVLTIDPVMKLENLKEMNNFIENPLR